MHLGADMMGNQPDDPLAISGRHRYTCIGNPGTEPVGPQPPVRIEHDFDNRSIFKPCTDLNAQRRAQHRPT